MDLLVQDLHFASLFDQMDGLSIVLPVLTVSSVDAHSCSTNKQTTHTSTPLDSMTHVFTTVCSCKLWFRVHSSGGFVFFNLPSRIRGTPVAADLSAGSRGSHGECEGRGS